MANFYHNTLNEEETNELRIRMEKAESDTLRVYEMAKTFKTLWRWKTVQLHHQVYKSEIQESVAGRALNDLCAMGYLVDTGERIKSEKGGRNFVYEVCDVEPVNPIKIPKKICVNLQFIEDEDGNYKLDMEKMSEEFISKLDYYDDLFNN
jgi:predicted transcriptional regulator